MIEYKSKDDNSLNPWAIWPSWADKPYEGEFKSYVIMVDGKIYTEFSEEFSEAFDKVILWKRLQR